MTTEGSSAEVAVLGIGRMGAAMARKLAEAGHRVTVWNRTPEPAQLLADELATAGLRAAPTAAVAAAQADFVLSVLASGAATEAVLLDPATLASLRPGAVVCDLATSGIETAELLSERFLATGVRFVDAPVSGSVPTVAAGQLLVMASGDDGDVAALEPVLAAFAKRVVRVGPAGAGQAMKLAVNLVVHGLNAAVSEALVLATRAGIEPAAAYDVFSDSVVAAPFVQYKRPAFLDPATPVAMTLDLSAKDLRLIVAAAESLGLDASVARVVSARVAAACADGYGDQDMAALSRFMAQ